MPIKTTPADRQRMVLDAARLLHEQLDLWIVLLKDGNKAFMCEWQCDRLPLEVVEYGLINCLDLGIGIAWNRSPYVDVDCDHEDAEANLVQLCGGPLPRTPTFRSRLGLHRVFLRPPDMPAKAWMHLSGVGQVLGLCPELGSQSAVPPTRGKDGKPRYWLPGLSLFDLDAALLPEAIADHLRQKARCQTPHGRVGSGGNPRDPHPHLTTNRPCGVPPAPTACFPPTWTLLQHVMTTVLGQPLRSNDTGRSTWTCPYCQRDTLFSFDHKPPYRDRFKCGGPCSWWHGDAIDILAYQAGRDGLIGDYGHLVMRLNVLTEEHQRLCLDGLHPDIQEPPSG
jgi:hypothetical protein